ncbi:reverse transcriptase domain-containing protein [Tanacetum coccineum]
MGTTWMDPIVEYLKDGKLPTNPAEYMLQEAHFGSCGSHSGARTLTQNATRLVGPFPEAPGCVKFLVVAVDYFTKWVEAEPLATFTGKNILKFVWKYRVSFWHSWSKNKTRKCQRTMGGRITKCFMGYRTTAHTGYNCTPFSLVYGSEAVLPPKIGLPTFRIHSFEYTANNDELRLNLDLLEERHELAALCEAKYKSRTEQYYNQNVRHTHLKVGDFVLRNNEASRQGGQRKLDPNWEGPYKIIKARSPGTYILEDLRGKRIPRT